MEPTLNFDRVIVGRALTLLLALWLVVGCSSNSSKKGLIDNDAGDTTAQDLSLSDLPRDLVSEMPGPDTNDLSGEDQDLTEPEIHIEDLLGETQVPNDQDDATTDQSVDSGSPDSAGKNYGANCTADQQCTGGLGCVGVHGSNASKNGVCSAVCGESSQCPDGFSCEPLPEFAAPGFCLKKCDDTQKCPSPQSCSYFSGKTQRVCWSWFTCDPIALTGCNSNLQCHYIGGKTICGEPGSTEITQSCKPGGSMCKAGLVCGKLQKCAPLCTTDQQCKDKGLDFCNKNIGSPEYGFCMHLR